MSTTGLAERRPGTVVRFRTAEGETHPEQVIYALRGVALALDEEQLGKSLERRQMERVEGLTAAAAILARWLTDRLE